MRQPSAVPKFPDEAEQHPQRSVVTRVLTGDPDDEPDLSVREARVGDRYLLCSDGLTDVVRDATIAETLAEHADPAVTADAFVQMALRGGGRDNVTCIVAHVVDVARESDVGSTTPQVVGAAAVHGTVSSRASASTPAAKAAAFERSASADPPDANPLDAERDAALAVAPPASKTRWALRSLLAVLVLAVLAGGGYAAYTWSQAQYFVGADGGSVAIYRGLPQDLGPITLSKVYERADVQLMGLPEYSRERVGATITADDLDDARSKVEDLRAQAAACALAAVPTASAAPTPTAPTPTAPTATPTPTPTPTPTSTPTSPVSCAGAS